MLTEEYCIVEHLSIKKVLSYLHFESVSPKIALNCVSFSFKILTNWMYRFFDRIPLRSQERQNIFTQLYFRKVDQRLLKQCS